LGQHQVSNADGQETKNGQIVRASKFSLIDDALMDSLSLILDIGSSNIEETMQLMKQMEGSHQNIDYFVIPVVEDVKQRRDSTRTVHELLKLGVDPNKIKVLFNKVGITQDVEDAFAELIHALKKLGVSYDTRAVIYHSEFFPAFERMDMSLDDFKNKIMAVPLSQNQARMNELRRNRNRTELEDKEFKELKSIIATQGLGIKAARDLDEVFKVLFKEELIQTDTDTSASKTSKKG
jgi:hypothetical protein